MGANDENIKDFRVLLSSHLWLQWASNHPPTHSVTHYSDLMKNAPTHYFEGVLTYLYPFRRWGPVYKLEAIIPKCWLSYEWMNEWLEWSTVANQKCICYNNYSSTLCIKCWVSAFIPRFNKISLLCKYHWFEVERGAWGWKEAQRQGKDTIIHWKALSLSLSLSLSHFLPHFGWILALSWVWVSPWYSPTT